MAQTARTLVLVGLGLILGWVLVQLIGALIAVAFVVGLCLLVVGGILYLVHLARPGT